MINFNIINKNIVGSVNGKTFSQPYSESLWEDLSSLNTKLNSASSMAKAKEIAKEALELVSTNPKKDIEIVTDDLTFNANTNTYHLKYNGKVSPVPLPKSLVDKILYAKDNDLPVTPLVKFAVRALRSKRVLDHANNPAVAAKFLQRVCDYSFQTFRSPTLYSGFLDEGFSEEVATEMATVPQTPITMEGLLCTKKVVAVKEGQMRYKWVKDGETGKAKKVLRDPDSLEVDPDTGETTFKEPEFSEDFIFEPAIMGSRGDAFSCGESLEEGNLGHVIRIGRETRLPSWECVDQDDARTCSKGLHTGNQDYINFWERPENVTLECLVDPSQIGAIPKNDADGVIRVKELFTYGIKDRDVDNKNLYHSSTYAELQDKRWAEYREEVVNRYEEKIEEVVKQLKEAKEAIID